ncbi:MAG: site-2 protease family protein [Bryobacterales bacterium]|nr:site-2 protease family protein [Bryobacterales bacterium]
MAEKDARMSGTVGVVTLFGVPIRLHFTFVLLLVFLLFIGIGGKQSAAMTAVYILALFGSVLLHELGHAIVAKRYGIRTVEIVMFPIGGLARLDRRPKAPEELWIALAGPAVNLAIAATLGLWLVYGQGLAPLASLNEPTDSNLAQRIATGNLLLAVFNMLPAYPMDGGRVLRALVARWRSEDEATQIAATAGKGLAFLMGLYGLLSGNFILIFIAMFVYLGASQESSVARGQSLTSGYPVRAAMVTDFRYLNHGETIRDATQLLLATSQQDFPVMHGGQVVGLLSRNALLRALVTVGADAFVAGSMDRDFVRLDPDDELSGALSKLSQSAALVMRGEELVGMLTAENLTEFLILRQITDLGGREQTA